MRKANVQSFIDKVQRQGREGLAEMQCSHTDMYEEYIRGQRHVEQQRFNSEQAELFQRVQTALHEHEGAQSERRMHLPPPPPPPTTCAPATPRGVGEEDADDRLAPVDEKEADMLAAGISALHLSTPSALPLTSAAAEGVQTLKEEVRAVEKKSSRARVRARSRWRRKRRQINKLEESMRRRNARTYMYAGGCD